MSKPVCLVTGVGPAKGTGGEIVKRFAEGGYQVAMLARNTENLKTLEKNIENAVAFPCDVGDLELLVKTIEQVKETLGHPEVVIHNALRSVRGSILECKCVDAEGSLRSEHRIMTDLEPLRIVRQRHALKIIGPVL